MRILVAAILALCADAAVGEGSIEAARKRMRNPDGAEVAEGVRLLVEIGTADAVRALRDEINRAHRRLDGHRRENDKLARETERLWPKLQKLVRQQMRLTAAGKQGSSSWDALMKRSQALKKKIDGLAKKSAAVNENARIARTTIRSGCDALRRFRSDEAIEAIEEGVRQEKRPDLQTSCIEALGHVARPRSLPVLRELVESEKHAVRLTLAVRALVKYAGHEGVPALASTVFSHRAWPARRAAHEVVAMAPTPVAVPLLAAAIGKEKGENRFRLAVALHRHTGHVFSSAKEWTAWWEEAQGGPLKRGTDPAPAPEGALLGIPSSSRRVWFVLCSWRSTTQTVRFEEMRDAIADAVAGLPGDAEFNIAHAMPYGLETFSKRMARARDSTKAKARTWLSGRKARSRASLLPSLSELFVGYDARGFAALPDTIVVAAAGHKKEEAKDGPLRRNADGFLDRLVRWNLAPGVVVHTVGRGDDIHRDLLGTVALSTGGAFVSDKQRLLPAPALPGADRVEAPRILRAAYRDASGWKALATIGAQAYPFKEIAAGYLAGEQPEELRIDALNVLAAMGSAARDVLPRVEALLDGDGAVAAAAKRARDALKGP